jgi:hypothetical protein
MTQNAKAQRRNRREADKMRQIERRNRRADKRAAAAFFGGIA